MAMGNYENKDYTHGDFEYIIWHEDGSITLKAPASFSCEEVKNLAIALIWDSSEDFLICGEDGCAGNYDMYSQLYNANNGLLYLILYSVSDDWRDGKEVTIHGRVPTEDELKEIEEYINNP